MTPRKSFVSRNEFCRYRAGVCIRQAQMLHERALEYPFWSSNIVKESRKAVHTLAAALEELGVNAGQGSAGVAACRRPLRRAIRLWDRWLTEDCLQRLPVGEAGDLLGVVEGLLRQLPADGPGEQAWYRLGREMADQYHGSEKSWPWRWKNLPAVKSLAAHLHVRLADLLDVSEAAFPLAGDLLYPEDLWGWYPVEAGLAKLGGVAAPLTTSHVGSPAAVESTSESERPRGVGKPIAYRFRRVGAVWQVRYRNERGQFPNSCKGFAYIAELLSKRNRPVKAVDLSKMLANKVAAHPPKALPPRTAPARAVRSKDLAAPDEGGSITYGGSAPEEVLDREARADYKRRILEINEELEEAAENLDEASQLRLEGEKEAILEQLKRTTGLGNRPNSAAAKPATKAADAVRKRLKAACDHIEKADPPMPLLVDHLRKCIKQESSTFAYYPPDPAPFWEL